MAIGVECWRCELPGHVAAECQPKPAKTETELKERFARYMELRISGRISTATKRAWVKADWKAYYDEKEKARK
jgi:hypothetical protein